MNSNQNNNLSQSEEAIKNGDFSDMENVIGGEVEELKSESLLGLASIDNNENNRNPLTSSGHNGEIMQEIANLRLAQEVFQDEVDRYEAKIQTVENKQEFWTKTKIVSKQEVHGWLEENNLFQSRSGAKIAMLLGGDRLSCCDEAVGIYDKTGEKMVGVATIAPEGEMRSGEPTIVGEFILPEFRDQGYGKELLVKTIKRCQERGFSSVRLDVQSGRIMKIIEKLPEETRNYLNVIDQSKFIDTDIFMPDDIN